MNHKEPSECCKECREEHVVGVYGCYCPCHSPEPAEKCPGRVGGFGCACPVCFARIQEATQEKGSEWEVRFDEEFVRSDGLMDKYAYDEDGDPDSTANAIKRFISSLLTQKAQEERERVLREVEAEMLDKIYYIGNELPQVKADVRDKFVLLGFPAKFLSDLRDRITKSNK